MSWRRWFGLAAPGPSADEVVSHAIESLGAFDPSARVERRDETSLVVRVGAGGEVLWNLADVVRLAASDPAWRDGVRSMAGMLLGQLDVERGASSIPMSPKRVAVIVWPQSRLRALGFEVVSEDLFASLGLVYGVRRDDRFRLIRPDELESSALDMRDLRKRALQNMKLSAKALELGFVRDDVPVLTNTAFHPHAASLLAHAATWTEFHGMLGPTLVAAPAPSRLFIGPAKPGIARTLDTLVAGALAIEETVLTRDILHFDGASWTVV